MENNIDELFKHLDLKKYPALKVFIETFGSQPETVPTTLKEKRKIAEKAKQEIASIRKPLENMENTLKQISDPEILLQMRCYTCKFKAKNHDTSEIYCQFSDSIKNDKSICTVLIDGKFKYEKEAE